MLTAPFVLYAVKSVMIVVLVFLVVVSKYTNIKFESSVVDVDSRKVMCFHCDRSLNYQANTVMEKSSLTDTLLYFRRFHILSDIRCSRIIW